MSATKPSILASAILPVENENGNGSRDLLVCIERSASSADQMLAVELGLPSPAAFVAKDLSLVKVSGQGGTLATLFAQASGFEPNTGDPLTMDLKRSSAGLELAVKARIGGGVTTVRRARLTLEPVSDELTAVSMTNRCLAALASSLHSTTRANHAKTSAVAALQAQLADLEEVLEEAYKCKRESESLLIERFVLILNAKKAELRACQSQQSSKEPLHGQRGSDESDAHDEEEDDDRSDGDDEKDTAAGAAATSFYGAPPPPVSSSSSSSSSLSSSSQITRSPVKRPLKKEKSSRKAGFESPAAALEEESKAYRGDDFQQGPAEGTQEVKAGDLDRLLTQDQLHDQQPPMSPPPLPPPVVSSSSSSSSSSGTSLSIPSPSANSTRQRPPPPKRHISEGLAGSSSDSDNGDEKKQKKRKAPATIAPSSSSSPSIDDAAQKRKQPKKVKSLLLNSSDEEEDSQELDSAAKSTAPATAAPAQASKKASTTAVKKPAPAKLAESSDSEDLFGGIE